MLSVNISLPSLAFTLAPWQGHLVQSINGLVLLFVVFVPLERIFALRPQQIFRRQFWADVGFFFMNRAIDTFAMALPFGVLAFTLSKLPLHGLHARVASWPLAWKLICALLIGELAAYWAHRLMHRLPLLWRFHAIHHSAEEMDWLVNVRVHPVEFVFMRLFQFVPLYALGFIQPGRKDAGLLMMALPIVAALWGYLIHANIKLRFGFVEWLVTTPAYHHWHHTNDGRSYQNKNFASMLPICDLIFGSFFLPKGQASRTFGIDEPIPKALPGMLTFPLVGAKRSVSTEEKAIPSVEL